MPKKRSDPIRLHHEGRDYTCKPGPGGTWYIHWTEGRRSRRVSTRAKFRTHAFAFLREWAKDSMPASAPTKVTTAQCWALKYGDGSNARAVDAWKALEPHFGDLAPPEVTQAVNDAYAKARGVAPSTLRVELAMLRAAWNEGVRQRLFAAEELPRLNPLPSPSPPRERVLSDAEIRRMLDYARHRNHRLWMFMHLALHTAARRTAIEELKWSQVDWQSGVIHYLKPGASQTRKRRASVPISAGLLPILRDAYAQRGDDPFVIGAGGHVNEAMRYLAKRVGVEGVTPHVFRHTAATIMARNGTPLWLVAKILGNTLAEVEQTYAKYQPGMAQAAVDGIVSI